MTLGDAALERQVLGMFASQSTNLIQKLAVLPAEAGALAHTLKGSARAIGAFRVAECAEELEAAIGKGGNCAKCQVELKAAVADARVGDRCAAAAAVMALLSSRTLPDSLCSGSLALAGSTRYRTARTLRISPRITSEHGQDYLCRP